jgi:hypothetical protein
VSRIAVQQQSPHCLLAGLNGGFVPSNLAAASSAFGRQSPDCLRRPPLASVDAADKSEFFELALELVD